jgi:hypothetical protein
MFSGWNGSLPQTPTSVCTRAKISSNSISLTLNA